jgi:DNA-binding IclR family transcriptional regulator
LPIANSFLQDQDALPHARAEMVALSRDLNLGCVASSVVDDEIVVLAQTSAPGSFGVNVRVGTRFSLVPPVGTVFLSWAGRERVRRWLAAVVGDRGGSQRERLLDALAVVRDRGYSVALGRPDMTADIDDYLLFQLDESQRLPITHIAAPIFDPEGTVRLAITVVGFHEAIASRDVPRVAERLQMATRNVARTTWGIRDDAGEAAHTASTGGT